MKLTSPIRSTALVVGAAIAFSPPCLSHAKVVAKQDFDGIPDGDTISSANSGTLGNTAVDSVTFPSTNNASVMRADADTLDLFGQGTANQYLTLIDDNGVDGASTNNGTPRFSIPAPLDGVPYHISFDFYDPDTIAVGPNVFGIRLFMGTGAYTFANVTTSFMDFDDGLLTAVYQEGIPPTTVVDPVANYTPNALHNLEIVGNYAASPYEYAGGSVPTGMYDLYLDGVLVADDVPNRYAATDSTHIWIGGSGNASIGSMYLDNFMVWTIPEPSSVAALLSVAGLGVCVRRRG